MKRRLFALALSCALALALLSACGGSPDGSVSGGGSSSGLTQPGGSAPDDSRPDGSSPDASQPSGSGSDTSLPGGAGSASSSAPGASQPGQSGGQESQGQMTLNRTDFSLFTPGATFRLKAADVPQGAQVTWSSSDEAVASVGEDGTVTYVSAGSATITAAAGDVRVTCKVYCKPVEDQPVSGGGSSSDSSSSGGSSSGGGSSSVSKVDLSAFYTTLSGSYEFPSFMAAADKELMDVFYPGLSGVATEQCLVYANQMSMNMGELVLVQVKDSKDVDAVKGILQSRIDGMVDGGAWYPEPTRVWSECSRVVSNGSYVMMVVNEDYAAIVDDFNALF